ncbi:MAG: glycosyltransferase [Deltaproteobacteria bacterium]|nr:glycosyltransferase [Deltaproteobacteria bacterium]
MSLALHIHFPWQEGPHGGANQFLKALAAELTRQGAHTPDPAAAAVILFNSHHQCAEILALRRKFPDKIYIHRVDGPMRLYNRPDDPRDLVVSRVNRLAADATVFQSAWSQAANHDLGWPPGGVERVIVNAPDPAIFHPPAEPREPGRPVRLIAASWSANYKKGFGVYEKLDRLLDFSRYSLTFVGNSPVKFANIVHLPPCPSPELAELLRGADVFLTAAQKEPCSNALIEALHSGLPALALADGGNPELVGRAGFTFSKATEIPELLERILADYPGFGTACRLPSLAQVAGEYLDLARDLVAARAAGRLAGKRPGWWAVWRERRWPGGRPGGWFGRRG